jgi:hypothetical protein
MIMVAMNLKSDKKTYIRRWRLEPKILVRQRGTGWTNKAYRLLYMTLHQKTS